MTQPALPYEPCSTARHRAALVYTGQLPGAQHICILPLRTIVAPCGRRTPCLRISMSLCIYLVTGPPPCVIAQRHTGAHAFAIARRASPPTCSRLSPSPMLPVPYAASRHYKLVMPSRLLLYAIISHAFSVLGDAGFLLDVGHIVIYHACHHYLCCLPF